MNDSKEIQLLRMRLSTTMKKQRMTQQDIFKRTGVTQSTISLFLSGRRGLNGDSALRIMKFIYDVDNVFLNKGEGKLEGLGHD